MDKKSDSSTRRPYVRLDFSLEQEEQLIKFVRVNTAIYDPKHHNYKNRKYRDQLWTQIGKTVNRCGSDCSKKWVNIRDLYIKNKEKPLGTGATADSKRRRNKLMSFLNEFIVRRTITNNAQSIEEIWVDDNSSADDAKVRSIKRRRSSSNDDTSQTIENAARSENENEEINECRNENSAISENCENNAQRNDTSYGLLNGMESQTGLELFFGSICKTVENFSLLDQAKIKMQISQIVGQVEIAHLERLEMNNGNRDMHPQKFPKLLVNIYMFRINRKEY